MFARSLAALLLCGSVAVVSAQPPVRDDGPPRNSTKPNQVESLPARELPAQLVAAWKKAGALTVWTSPNEISQDRLGKDGEVPGFQLRWAPGIAALPRPQTAFGLSFGSGGMTDAGLRELAELKTLQYLFLYNTPVTDAGMKELAGLTSLQALSLASTKVTDVGLKELTGLNNLQFLHLARTQVTDAGVAKLQKALPQLKVER
jgi:internalin A